MMTALPLHQQQQFDFLLHTAVERYVERLTYRCSGVNAALQRLREDAESEGVRLTEFAQAVFRDFLLDNAAGAAFVLQAMAQSQPIEVPQQPTLEAQLQAMAVAAFARIMRSKTEETLEREAVFESQGQEHA